MMKGTRKFALRRMNAVCVNSDTLYFSNAILIGCPYQLALINYSHLMLFPLLCSEHIFASHEMYLCINIKIKILIAATLHAIIIYERTSIQTNS